MKCKCIELSDISEYEDNDSCKAKYTIMQLQQENKRLKDNWNMLKEHLANRYNDTKSISHRDIFKEIKEAMQIIEIRQELEKGDK